jgi:2-octaprenyl-6-methoxyphenol hydroxylase
MKNSNNGICILGCGISGMITALGFAKNKIKVTIIEAKNIQDERFFEDIRTTALTDYSKNYFESIDLWPSLAKLVGPINDIYVVDNKAPEMLHFGSRDLPENGVMGYLIQNKDFKKALLAEVTGNPYINIIDKTNYTKIDNFASGALVHLDNDKALKADLVVVCDGYNSEAKQTFFSARMTKYYGQHALTFITKHEKPHGGTAVEHFMPSGPFAILPLKDEYHSSIVWTVKAEQAGALMSLDREELTYLVQENFGPFLGKVEIEGQVAAFPLKAYQTDRYFNKSLTLVADTAHIIHPLAGQGLNQGIKDIEALITMTMRYPDNGSALTNYQKSRKDDNANMLAITDTLNVVFSNNSELLHSARQTGFKAIESIPPFKKALIKYAMGKR